MVLSTIFFWAKFFLQLFKNLLYIIYRFVNFTVLGRKDDFVNDFLRGNFAPVGDEITAEGLPVLRGSIPDDLRGMFVRNGPNPKHKPAAHEYHWFNGDGMLHGVHLRDGKATYNNKWVRTGKLKAEDAAGRPLLPLVRYVTSPLGMLEGNIRLLLNKWYRKFTGKNMSFLPFGVANTALEFHDRRLLALVENYAPHHVVAPSLDTVAEYNYNKKLKHPFTAHPKVDPVTQELFFFGYSLLRQPWIQYSVVSAKGDLVSTVDIPVEKPIMMHDFAITKNYAVFLDLPLTFEINRVLEGKAVLDFDPQTKARIGVIPRYSTSSNDIQWFECDSSFYVFHVINAFEDEETNEVVLHACRAPHTGAFNLSYHPSSASTTVSGGLPARLHEWRCNLKSGKIAKEQELISQHYSEFPSIHPALIGRRHRYAYLARLKHDSSMPVINAQIKYDYSTGKYEIFEYGPGRFGGEGVFVPKSPDCSSGDEDDGYVVTFVYDENKNTSSFIVLDAKHIGDSERAVVAEVQLPRRVPYGFHGKWLTQAQIDSQRTFFTQ